MIRVIWYKLRRIRAHTLFLLFILSLVIYCLRLPDSLAEHPEHQTGHHRGLLVTTPTNQSYPLHYLSLGQLDSGKLVVSPVNTQLSGHGRQSVSHLIGHPRREDLFYINNEVVPGSILTGTLSGTTNGSDVDLAIHTQDPSQGDEPAHSLVTRDGQHLVAINYGSSAIVLYSIEKGGQLKPRQALGLPRPTWIDQSTSPHHHHIAQHPRDSRTFYVTDLGYNVVYVLRETRSRVKTSLEVVQTFDTKAYGQGPRNGVVSQNGKTYFLSFQTSSTVIAFPLDRHNLLLGTQAHPIYTLPDEVVDEGISLPDGTSKHASSDILLLHDQLFVANRRVVGPYLPTTHMDTIAIFDIVKSRLIPAGHIRTGCWKPRELLLVKEHHRDLLAVTCNGEGKQGAGVVLFDPQRGLKEVARWDSGMPVFGIVGVTIDV